MMRRGGKKKVGDVCLDTGIKERVDTEEKKNTNGSFSFFLLRVALIFLSFFFFLIVFASENLPETDMEKQKTRYLIK